MHINTVKSEEQIKMHRGIEGNWSFVHLHIVLDTKLSALPKPVVSDASDRETRVTSTLCSYMQIKNWQTNNLTDRIKRPFEPKAAWPISG